MTALRFAAPDVADDIIVRKQVGHRPYRARFGQNCIEILWNVSFRYGWLYMRQPVLAVPCMDACMYELLTSPS